MKHILVVDDEPEVVHFLQRFLETKGYRVSTAFDGREALAAFEKNPVDLIVLDIFMPEIDGLEVMKILMLQVPELPVLVISGGSPVDGTNLLKVAMDLGARQVFEKPIALMEILKAVEEEL